MGICDVAAVKNLGYSQCKKIFQALESGIKTPRTFKILKTDAGDPTKWQDALEAATGERIYLLPLAFDSEVLSEEAVRQTSTLGKEVGVRDGQYRFRLQFTENLEWHKALFTHKNTGGSMFLMDNKKRLLGWSPSDEDLYLYPLDLDVFDSEKLNLGTGDSVTTSPLYFTLSDNTQIDGAGQIIDFSAIYRQLVPLTTVKMEVLAAPAPTPTAFTGKITSILDGYGISGFDPTGIDMTIGTGTISAAVEDTAISGQYVITGTAMAGEFNLKGPNALSIRSYESSGAADTTL